MRDAVPGLGPLRLRRLPSAAGPARDCRRALSLRRPRAAAARPLEGRQRVLNSTPRPTRRWRSPAWASCPSSCWPVPWCGCGDAGVFGEWGALAAVFLFTNTPAVLAHAGLATMDMAVGAGVRYRALHVHPLARRAHLGTQRALRRGARDGAGHQVLQHPGAPVWRRNSGRCSTARDGAAATGHGSRWRSSWCGAPIGSRSAP